MSDINLSLEDIKVSVLLIVYNHEKYLSKCIESVLSQKTDFKYELLIYDDASSDKSAQIILDYQKKHPDKIRSVIQEENQFQKGLYHTEENLIPLVRGKYVAWVEGDDYWCDDNKLQLQYEALENHPECSICVHKTQYVDTYGINLNRVEGEGIFEEGNISCSDFFEVFFQKNIWPFQTSSYFVRTEIFKERPYFWEKFYVGDLPCIMWAAHRGSLYFIDRIMSCYRNFVSGSATDMNRNRKFGLHKAKTNAEGLMAFNDITDGAYWGYLKHITCYYAYQYYKGAGKIISEQLLLESKNELSMKEKIILSMKYTALGYALRNMRENRYRKKLKKVKK